VSASARGAERARAHLLAIARTARPAGGDAEAAARTYCAAALTSAGFAVREATFEYSDVVGRFAMPTIGAVWAAAVTLAAVAGSAGRPAAALLALSATLVAVVLGARWATRRGVLDAPVLRRRGVNLVATRGAATPTLWLVAHLDSKSQPVPMAARVAGVATSMLLWTAAFVVVGLQLGGARVAGAWTPLGVLGVLGALPVIGSGIGARSPGAIDNASGVVAVLLAATDEQLDAPPLPHAIGVLLTSAEEVGLAGARAWARSADAARAVDAARATGDPAVALNVDSVDDAGALRVMTASPLPPSLDRALGRERALRRGRLPTGVLVDAIALADGGLAALTISKATVATLSRIHTPRDAVDVVQGDGMVEAAGLVRRLAAAVAHGRAGMLDPASVAG